MQGTHLEVACNHYQSSVDTLKTDIIKRDRYFIYVLVGFCLILTQLIDATVISLITSKTLELPADNIINNGIVRVLVWAVIFYFFIRYTQFYFSIERGYKYLSHLENILSKCFNKKLFIKESIFYKSEKSRLGKINKTIFKYIFPFLFIFLLLMNIDNMSKPFSSYYQFVELFLNLLFVIYICLFVSESRK